jgi:hypothetical protein
MPDTQTLDDKFKAAFGFITDDALAARKSDVNAKLTAIEQDINALPGTTPAESKEFNTAQLGKLKQNVSDTQLSQKPVKEQYEICTTTDKRADKLSRAVRALKESEDQLPKLKQLVANGSAADLKKLDDLVKKIGDKAKSAKEQGFMIAAIRARFDIDELSGDLSSGALPRFYQLLRKIPPEHARLNDKLKRIHREKDSSTSTAAAGQMTIHAGLSSRDNTTEKFNDSEGKRLKLNEFDQTTLHEIGHTVDEAYEFMLSKRGDKDFGGWEDSSLDEVARLIAARLKASHKTLNLSDAQWAWVAEQALIVGKIDQKYTNALVKKTAAQSLTEQACLADKAIKAVDDAVATFLKNAKDQNDAKEIQDWVKDLRDDDLENHMKLSDYKPGSDEKTFITLVVDEMLGGKPPRRADGVIKQLKTDLVKLNAGIPDKTSFEALKKDVWIERAAKMAGNLWEKSHAEILETQLGDKIYQFNQTKWWKYDPEARKTRVSNYQFRSPLEWFVEVYAVFQLGKLNTGHPCYPLIDKITTKQV